MSYVVELDSVPKLLEESPFLGYTYSYPHKTAHRPLDPPIQLGDAWAAEPRGALYLYIHVPFCEMRCGFCNLFALARPDSTLTERYLETIRFQAKRVRAAIGSATFARFALGGGTPTWLSERQLEHLLVTASDVMGADLASIPVSVEASPTTITAEKLAVLRAFGVDRISVGVQSFVERDARAMGRPQHRKTVEHALDLIRAAGFPTLNIDLMYGAETETVDSWLACLAATLDYQPEEVYLYPLYIRPLTGLGKRTRIPDDRRLSAYRAGRSVLTQSGYRQISLRMFRSLQATDVAGPVYCCQEDGMVGLGCGARSYTRALHYSNDYAVPAPAVRRILERFVQRNPPSFDVAEHGIWLDVEDQQRRYAILSLLQADGLSRLEFQRRFGVDPFEALGQLRELQRHQLLTVHQGGKDLPKNDDCRRTGISARHNCDGQECPSYKCDAKLVLTPAGMERSAAIGPWLYSEKVRRRMESYQWRCD